jgi:hypothetical protein
MCVSSGAEHKFWIQTLLLCICHSFINCVTLSKVLRVPQFAHLQIGDETISEGRGED